MSAEIDNGLFVVWGGMARGFIKVLPTLGGIVAVLLATSAALGLRYAAIEPPHLAHLCQEISTWWCAPREMLIEAVHANAIGVAAVVTAIVAIARKSRFLGAASVAIAAMGLVLYSFDWAAIALLLGLGAWFREHKPDQSG